jgi:hypothetical protein
MRTTTETRCTSTWSCRPQVGWLARATLPSPWLVPGPSLRCALCRCRRRRRRRCCCCSCFSPPPSSSSAAQSQPFHAAHAHTNTHTELRSLCGGSCLLDASEPAIVIVTLVWSSSRCAPDAGGGRLALRLVWQRDPLGCPLPRGSCRPAACFHRLGVPADRLRQPRCAPTEPRGGAGLDARSKAGATSTIDGLLSALDRSASSV